MANCVFMGVGVSDFGDFDDFQVCKYEPFILHIIFTPSSFIQMFDIFIII